MAKRTASEVLAALEEDALDAEMEAVLAMTPEERRRDLQAAGFDLDKVHAQADAVGAEPRPPVAAEPAERVPPASVTVMRPKRRRMAVVVPAAMALAAGVAVAVSPYVMNQGVSAHHPVDARARGLRQQARDDCDARRWEACLQKLDDARALDPEGDGAEDVRTERRTAGDALHPK